MLTYSRVVFATIDAAKLIKKIFRAIIFPIAEFRTTDAKKRQGAKNDRNNKR